jgi:hypothetical protein
VSSEAEKSPGSAGEAPQVRNWFAADERTNPMSCGCSGGCDGETVVDVRAIAPRDRHALIFRTFALLEEGEGFLLVNDHDPKHLRSQFRADYPDCSPGSTWSKGRISGVCASRVRLDGCAAPAAWQPPSMSLLQGVASRIISGVVE